VYDEHGKTVLSVSHYLISLEVLHGCQNSEIMCPPQFLVGIFEELCIPDMAHHLGKGYGV
jgi:hypothetical protein